jgi:hypothetical protein
MNKKKIIIISIVVVLSIIIIPTVLTTGSILFTAPEYVMFSTLDFIGTEKEFREIIENTPEAKLFRETFGENVKTKYWVELAYRTMVFSTEENTTLTFKQMGDRTIVIHYSCHKNDERIGGYVTSFEILKESGCF